MWVNECGLENEVICPNIPLNAVSVWNIVEMRLLEAQKKAIVIVMKSMVL